MTITISNSSVIPVTREQKEAFVAWVSERYASYEAYVNASGKREIDEYIRTHIFSEDMKAVWCESCELEIDDLYRNRIKLYRSHLLKKVRYMRMRLGKLAFPDEAHVYHLRMAQKSEVRIPSQAVHIPAIPAVAVPVVAVPVVAVPVVAVPVVAVPVVVPDVVAVRRFEVNLTLDIPNVPIFTISIPVASNNQLDGYEYSNEFIEAAIRVNAPLIADVDIPYMLQIIRQRLIRRVAQVLPRMKKFEYLTEVQANTDMKESCSICMEVHKMLDVCTTMCGHQFGAKCLSTWKNPTCPLCREVCSEVTEYKVSS